MRRRLVWGHALGAVVIVLVVAGVYLASPASESDLDPSASYAAPNLRAGIEIQEVGPGGEVGRNVTWAVVEYEAPSKLKLALSPSTFSVSSQETGCSTPFGPLRTEEGVWHCGETPSGSPPALHHTACAPNSVPYQSSDGVWHCGPPGSTPPPPRQAQPDPGTCALDHYWDGFNCNYAGGRCPSPQQFNYYLGRCVGDSNPQPPPPQRRFRVTVPYALTIVPANVASDVQVRVTVVPSLSSFLYKQEQLTFGAGGGTQTSRTIVFEPVNEADLAGMSFDVTAYASANDLQGKLIEGRASTRLTQNSLSQLSVLPLTVNGLAVTSEGEPLPFEFLLHPVSVVRP